MVFALTVGSNAPPRPFVSGAPVRGGDDIFEAKHPNVLKDIYVRGIVISSWVSAYATK
jgi:hypothetical protein